MRRAAFVGLRLVCLPLALLLVGLAQLGELCEDAYWWLIWVTDIDKDGL